MLGCISIYIIELLDFFQNGGSIITIPCDNGTGDTVGYTQLGDEIWLAILDVTVVIKTFNEGGSHFSSNAGKSERFDRVGTTPLVF